MAPRHFLHEAPHLIAQHLVLGLKPGRIAAQAGDVHLQLLSHVAVLVMDEHFRADVLASDDPEQIAARLNEDLAE